MAHIVQGSPLLPSSLRHGDSDLRPESTRVNFSPLQESNLTLGQKFRTRGHGSTSCHPIPMLNGPVLACFIALHVSSCLCVHLGSQVVSTGLWAANFVVPGLGASSKLTQLIGKNLANVRRPAYPLNTAVLCTLSVYHSPLHSHSHCHSPRHSHCHSHWNHLVTARNQNPPKMTMLISFLPPFSVMAIAIRAPSRQLPPPTSPSLPAI